MFRYFLIATLVLFALFFRFPEWHTPVPQVLFLGAYDLQQGQAHGLDRKVERFAFQAVPVLDKKPGKENRIKKIIHYRGPETQIREGQLVYVPVHGPGYFSYGQASSKVYFHSSDGEILWERDYHSYPVSNHDGSLVFLLTGDGNRIDILDRNGNSASVPHISGNILNDYGFAAYEGSACAAFSNTLYVISDEGGVKAQYRAVDDTQPRQSTAFFKGCAISPDGSSTALHLQKKDKDYIYTFQVSRKQQTDDENRETTEISLQLDEEIELPSVYPHLIAMGVNRHGVIVGTPERTLLYSGGGELLMDRKVPIAIEEQGSSGGRSGDVSSVDSVYRAVYAGEDFFAWGEKDSFTVVDKAGRVLASFAVPVAQIQSRSRQEDRPGAKDAKDAGEKHRSGFWRFIPGRSPGVFAVHTEKAVVFYGYRIYDRNLNEEQ